MSEKNQRTTGTPGFLKERLREARLARGISTQLTLAGLIGKNSSSISRWEDGSASPPHDALEMLADVLKVRIAFFLRPQLVHGDYPFFFRSLASARVKQLNQQRSRLRWVQEIGHVAQHYVEFPQLNVPDVLRGDSYETLRDEDLERIAWELRQHWKLGTEPVTDMVSVLENAGIVVACDEVGTTNLDGVCTWSDIDGRPYILLAQDKMSFPRRQMDAAHEMAHAILHRRVNADGLRRNFDLIEGQAFRLASAFLMPHSRFPLEVRSPTLGSFLALKEKWRVSVKAMIKRCQDLELIDAEHARQLYKHYSAKGWTRGEPLDQRFPLNPPKLLGDAIRMIVNGGVRSKADLLANEFVISARDVEQLTGLDEGWFDIQLGEIVALKPRSAYQQRVDGSTGQVVQFPGDGKIK